MADAMYGAALMSWGPNVSPPAPERRDTAFTHTDEPLAALRTSEPKFGGKAGFKSGMSDRGH